MEYREIRELVRIRHELRTLAALRAADTARPLIDRMTSLAERDPIESAAVQTEVSRWRFVFRLEDGV